LPLLLIAGPTASGKSGLAVRAAKFIEKYGYRSCIINADASQVYSNLSIVSARPDKNEMQGIPHRLFGYRDGATSCSAADWADDAKNEIKLAIRSGTVPIVAGGTGLYIRTLLDGIAPVPEIDAQIRAKVRVMDLPDAYAALISKDPAIAEQINANDRSRVQRALEVILSTGSSLLQWRADRVGGIIDQVDLHPFILLPDRTWLYGRCDRRFVAMIERGAISEIDQLLQYKLPDHLPVMRAIGVAEVRSYLEGQSTHENMIAAGQMATRRYAKRQYTWLRNQPPTEWPRLVEDPAEMREDAIFSDWLTKVRIQMGD